jgi:hypothetical protein
MLLKVALLINKFFINIQDTIFTFVAILFFSKINKPPVITSQQNSCVIFANGPSLNIDYDKVLKYSSDKDIICFNDFAETSQYTEVKPRFYVLQDPYYWDAGLPENYELKRSNLFKRMNDVTDWDISLFIPWEMKKSEIIKNKVIKNPHINLYYYNRMPIAGFRWFRFLCFKYSLGLPSGQNILITSIFMALKMNYRNIYIAGADHSLHENLLVGKDNIVYVKLNHFYDNGNVNFKQYSRSYISNKPIKISEYFTIWAKVFEAYQLLDEYATKLNIKIYNISSTSFIDAFERRDINSL